MAPTLNSSVIIIGREKIMNSVRNYALPNEIGKKKTFLYWDRKFFNINN